MFRGIRRQSARDLVERAKRDDQEAFAEIFRRQYPRLLGFCIGMLGERAMAEDVAQESIAKALKRLPGEAREIHLDSWLITIARNECIDVIRRRRFVDSREDVPERFVGSAEDSAITRESLDVLIEDVRTLPERQRIALLMRELGGDGYETIGEQLGVSRQAARQAAYEARQALLSRRLGRELDCELARHAIEGGDRPAARGRALRLHLETCEECRALREAVASRKSVLALLPAALLGAGSPVAVAGGAGGGGTGSAVNPAALAAGLAGIAATGLALAAIAGGAMHGDGGGGDAAWTMDGPVSISEAGQTGKAAGKPGGDGRTRKGRRGAGKRDAKASGSSGGKADPILTEDVVEPVQAAVPAATEPGGGEGSGAGPGGGDGDSGRGPSRPDLPPSPGPAPEPEPDPAPVPEPEPGEPEPQVPADCLDLDLSEIQIGLDCDLIILPVQVP